MTLSLLIISGIFVVALAARMYSAQVGMQTLKLISTPIVTTTSTILCTLGVVKYPTIAGYLFVTLMILSLVGDVFNCVGNHLFYGLIFFAIAHILMIVVMGMNTSATSGQFLGILFLIGMGVIYYFAYPKLDGMMKYAVPVYMLLATTSVVLGIGYVAAGGSVMFFTGLVLFYVSDIILAITEFIFPTFKYAGIGIWITYGPAMFLMSLSTIYGSLK